MGLTDKITGRIKKAAGDLADDASLRREGRQEERKGEAKEELAEAHEKADRKAEEVADLERKTLSEQSSSRATPRSAARSRPGRRRPAPTRRRRASTPRTRRTTTTARPPGTRRRDERLAARSEPRTRTRSSTSSPTARWPATASRCVHDAAGVSDDVMLAFARETKLMETTFVQPADVAGADYRNRIWTVAEEVPFAGHPSLGTAVAVALQRGEEDVVYHQQTLAGIQEVRVSRGGDRARASVVQERAETGPGGRPGGRDGRRRAAAGRTRTRTCRRSAMSTGLPALIAPVADREALTRAHARRAGDRRARRGRRELLPVLDRCRRPSTPARARSRAWRSRARTRRPAQPPARCSCTRTTASGSSTSRSIRASRWAARAA